MAQGILPLKYKTGVEWAEVCHVPNAIGNYKKGLGYRYEEAHYRRTVLVTETKKGLSQKTQPP